MAARSCSPAGEHLSGAVQRFRAWRLERVEALGAAAAYGCWVTHVRAQVPLTLHAVERRIDGPDRNRPAFSVLDLLPDRHAVRPLTEAGNGEQDDVLELT